MDVKIFFSGVNEKLYSDIETNQSFFKNLFLPGPGFPDVKKADIALIGLEESRGSSHNKEANQGADGIREKLYRLKKGTRSYKIIDLGNLRNGHSLEETILRLKEVCKFLIDHEVFPLLFRVNAGFSFFLSQACSY